MFPTANVYRTYHDCRSNLLSALFFCRFFLSQVCSTTFSYNMANKLNPNLELVRPRKRPSDNARSFSVHEDVVSEAVKRFRLLRRVSLVRYEEENTPKNHQCTPLKIVHCSKISDTLSNKQPFYYENFR